MQMTKKVSMGVGFARKKAYEYEGQKYEADIKDGDILTILDEGKIIVGQYGEQHVFKVKTRNGEKGLTFNQKSVNNLIDAFGTDSVEWVGKEVKAWVLKAMVSGKMSLIAYITHPDAEMDDDGDFSTKGSEVNVGMADEYPEYEGEPNFDIPA